MSKEKQSKSTNTGTKTVVKESFKIQLPKNFGIMLHNNNYTYPLAVVDVLEVVFQKSGQDAQAIMLHAHTTGKALVVAPLSKEVAELKLKEAKDYCKKQHEAKVSYGDFLGRYDILQFSVEEMD